ncbi:MAG TPA: NAD(P)/FAD-dependent oxidoreductase [Polyangiaceae bacterium LLY-WYZ-15_(1-7)]|nr:hypothetical protein [Myxococcales bacterium]MAT24037.1 hypothetical protein [Sandaracinus sp.]HJK94898.1 NAD(P)/FAD-dependent oxidoreductase [Polyangiaceae bacterium LLY-WYZ-15_(1-7)]MBJ72605.1 hypothetical protein [Sandaracinus sp.]HJL06426.1 NAD(P)/FAD-dependent oxidoreductase [Polyangiaceae bacterium LLY-WYZ-15_(1-7)]
MASIAIVGGGPGGSAFALWALRAGVAPGDLVILDKAAFPRPKLCGGALTFRGTETLRELLGQPGGGGETRGLEFRCALGSFPVRERDVQWLYDRALLDDTLLQACVDAGVEVRERCQVTGVEPTSSGWRVEWKGLAGRQHEGFDWVVGADGARGVVRRAAGLRGGIVGRLVEAVYEPVEAGRWDPTTLYFDFDPILDGIPGYGWIFPYPKPGATGLWKLGVMDGRGVASGSALKAWTEAYAARSGFRRVDEKIAGWPEHYWSPKTEAHRPGLILTGEAWGIDPLLGEGIAPALEISRYAAGRLKEALDAGTPTIPGYERGFRKTPEGRNLKFQWRLAEMLYGPQAYRWLRVLFGHAYMKQLAAAGTEAYGRLAQHVFKLARSYAWQVLREGFPSNAPIERDAA